MFDLRHIQDQIFCHNFENRTENIQYLFRIFSLNLVLHEEIYKIWPWIAPKLDLKTFFFCNWYQTYIKNKLSYGIGLYSVLINFQNSVKLNLNQANTSYQFKQYNFYFFWNLLIKNRFSRRRNFIICDMSRFDSVAFTCRLDFCFLIFFFFLLLTSLLI